MPDSGRRLILGNGEKLVGVVEKKTQFVPPAFPRPADGVEDVQPKWINTKDEQPRDGETVLVLYRTQVIAAQHNLNSSNESCWTLWTCPGSVNSETSRSTITLWMRLPPMPIRRGEE